MSGFRDPVLIALRAKTAGLQAHGRISAGVLAFGDRRIDRHFRAGGLPLGQWHEIVGEGLELETSACPAAFAAVMASPLARRGEAVWILRRDDLFAPGLSGLGFPVERLIQVCARDETEALAVAEDALSTEGVSAVFTEVDDVDLVAGRRLKLACERRGATGFVIRRRPYGGGGDARRSGTTAATRWKISTVASQPEPGTFGLGPPRWRADLELCRGGRPGTWLMEAQTAFTEETDDGTHPLRLVAELGDQQLAPPQFQRWAG